MHMEHKPLENVSVLQSMHAALPMAAHESISAADPVGPSVAAGVPPYVPSYYGSGDLKLVTASGARPATHPHPRGMGVSSREMESFTSLGPPHPNQPPELFGFPNMAPVALLNAHSAALLRQTATHQWQPSAVGAAHASGGEVPGSSRPSQPPARRAEGGGGDEEGGHPLGVTYPPDLVSGRLNSTRVMVSGGRIKGLAKLFCQRKPSGLVCMAAGAPTNSCLSRWLSRMTLQSVHAEAARILNLNIIKQ